MNNEITTPLLEVSNLEVSFYKEGNEFKAVKGISYNIYPNEILALVGESGSGKSVSALSILGLLPKSIGNHKKGSITFNHVNLNTLSSKELSKLRGKDIGIIFQEPMSALNPSMRCGQQVEEVLKQHTNLNKTERRQEVLTLFEQVKLPNPTILYKAYPHEISGGQQQRVMIAMAIACKPKLLIADEPTTALDVTVQKDIIELLKILQKRQQMSVLFISHDLALVSEIADRVLVMFQGTIVEQNTTRQIFKNPQHSYTKALIMSRPSSEFRLKKLPTIKDILENTVDSGLISSEERAQFHRNMYEKLPILEVTDLSKTYFSKVGWFSRQTPFEAVKNVSFKVYPGETLGLVGESGCGKSTLSKAIMLLDPATSGSIRYNGEYIHKLKPKRIQSLRKDIQIIFQDPYASLNPRITVSQALIEPMTVHNIGNNRSDRLDAATKILEEVGLDKSSLNKYPHEFSGGQRQRIGIARAIVLKPKLIICDESVSALDISVQAQVLNLLNDLKQRYGFTYIFISHDLNVVKYMSDQLLVMNKGRIEESGDADDIYNTPKKDYTKKLIHAIPKGL